MSSEWRNVADMTSRSLRELAQIWDELLTDDASPPYTDRRHEMPVNFDPFHPDFVKCFPGNEVWPTRDLGTLTGLTIHHTMSHSPIATANYCTKTKGYPTTQYHYWVSAGDGCPCYLLVDPSAAMWHDHTGTHPTTLSIGMAGSLHVSPPPDEQIEAAARLCVWLMNQFGVVDVAGHKDRYRGTVCPGWDSAGWRTAFFDVLERRFD